MSNLLVVAHEGRMTRLVCGALMMAAGLLLVPSLSGQSMAQFTAPTDAELKMTVDAKAPGADAVILDREEDFNDLDQKYFLHLRIKVLTEKGKELATVRVPYDPGSFGKFEVQARTIHPDGVIVPLSEAPKEISEVKTAEYDVRSMVFNLPSVETGSILEYLVRIHDGYWVNSWEVQQSHFVRHERFIYKANGRFGLATAAHIPTGQLPKLDKGSFTLELTDVPAFPDEDWMPPMNTLRWRVQFYVSDYQDSKQFWEDATRRWARSVNEFTDPTGTLKKAAVELTSTGDGEEQKARKLYDAVQSLDNTSFSRERSKAERKQEGLKDIKRAEDIWKEKRGSGNGLALLYVALARAAGLKVKTMQVVNRDRALWDGKILSLAQLDDFIVIASLNGREVTLDPGQKYCPFGSLHWKHTLATGLELNDKSAVLKTTPAPTFKDSVLQRSAYLDMDAEGRVSGTVRLGMTGPRALYWRQLALRNDKDEVKKLFGDWVRTYIPEGIDADFDHFLGMEDVKSSLTGVVKISGQFATATGIRLIAPGVFFETNARQPFVTLEKRQTPIDVEYPEVVGDEVTYALPAGYAVEGSGPTADVAWPGYAVLRIEPTFDGGRLEVKRTLEYNFTLLGANLYPELHTFYQKVATADQQQLVLTRTIAAKGN
jgi:hypothetical protein